MCGPIALGAVIVAGAVVQGVQAKMAGNAASAQASFNARLADMQASDALDRSNQEVGNLRIKGSILGSKQKAAYAAAGVDPSVGTPSDVQGASALMSGADIATAKANAAREAWGFKMKAQDERIQAGVSDRAGTFGMIGSILGGASSAALGYHALSK